MMVLIDSSAVTENASANTNQLKSDRGLAPGQAGEGAHACRSRQHADGHLRPDGDRASAGADDDELRRGRGLEEWVGALEEHHRSNDVHLIYTGETPPLKALRIQSGTSKCSRIWCGGVSKLDPKYWLIPFRAADSADGSVSKQPLKVRTSVGDHDVEAPGFRFDVSDGRSVSGLVAGHELNDVHFARVLCGERLKVGRRLWLSRARKDDDDLSLCDSGDKTKA